MKRRFFSILLSLCMVLMLCPVAAFAEETPRIDITLSGFEVGNTPADCTFTIINSTLDDDISVGVSEICWYVNNTEGRHVMSDTAKFEPDTTYEVKFLTVSLTMHQNISSLTVTVNGKTTAVQCYGFDWGAHVVFDKLPALTINGADQVCAQQDYEFTVTPATGVTLDKKFGHDTGFNGSDIELTIGEDGVGHGVVPAAYYDPNTNSFDVIAHGSAADGTPVSTTKHVEVSQAHIYEDGVCGCGEKQKYTVTYDPGDGEGSISAGTKSHGENFTLSSATFTREGFVQTGWMSKDFVSYDLGGVYTTDADVTLYPVWDKIVTLTVPFTTTVTLGGNGVPGETVFTLDVVDANAGEETYADVTVSGSVTTDGAGSYSGTMTLTGPSGQLRNMLCEGAFVKQVDGGEDGWTYDDTMWGLLLTENETSDSLDGVTPAYSVQILPASCEETEDGTRCELDWDAEPVEQMSFTNTYTKSTIGATTNTQTGDSINLTLWFNLLTISAAVVIGTGMYSKRGRSSRAK